MESSPQSAETVLKVDCDGDLRRALLSGTLSYAGIDRAVQQIWPGRSAHEAKYMDEEDDACSLTELTFADFLCTAKPTATAQVLRLMLHPAAASSDTTLDSSKAPTAEESFSMPWQHVEQGSDAGEEGPHTVADLTDIHDDEEDGTLQSDQSPPAPVESSHPSEQTTQEVAADPSCEEEPETVEERGAERKETSTMPAEDIQTDAGYPIQDGIAGQEQLPEESLEDVNRRFEEQIDIVIAAFDEDGDGYLSFKETLALVRCSCGDTMPRPVFEELCGQIGADASQGLSRDALICIYSCGTSWMALERDFEAARRRLEGARPKPKPKTKPRPESQPVTIGSLLFSNPLFAAPFALDVAERVRQSVVSR